MSLSCTRKAGVRRPARSAASRSKSQYRLCLPLILASIILASCSGLGLGAWDIISKNRTAGSTSGTEEDGSGGQESSDTAVYTVDTRAVSAMRIRLALNGITSDTSVTDFPLLVHLRSGSAVYSYSTSDGGNLAFRDADGYGLPYERESWTYMGDSYFWVKIRSFSDVSSDYIYVYFLSSPGDCGDHSNAASVWSNGYAAVWHGTINGSGIVDSLNRHNGNFTSESQTSGTVPFTLPSNASDGQIGAGISFSGGSCGFAAPHADDIDSHSALAFDCWLRLSSLPSNKDRRIFHKGGEYLVIDNDDPSMLSLVTVYNKTSYTYSAKSAGAVLSGDSTWHHFAVSWQGGSGSDKCTFYMDGSPLGSSGEKSAIADDMTGTYELLADDSLDIGNLPSGSKGLNGDMDEIRLSTVSRSDAWMMASFKNQKDSSALPETAEAVP